MVEIIPGSEGAGGVGAGQRPDTLVTFLLYYARSLQMINLVMRFIIKLICEQTEACRLR